MLVSDFSSETRPVPSATLSTRYSSGERHAAARSLRHACRHSRIATSAADVLAHLPPLATSWLVSQAFCNAQWCPSSR
ncbi:hypothetical protein D3C81_2032160 [compost metagenome]